ncbi:hypothetical protein Taro_014538 [Colocasia esculenta]|uniref:PHD-type domain-containing protein n=1 Tax=Colocasia esculenta TaxID=4460 RepID=A0A843U990_COLES|nr:hypothetical protein [Colocasia esculenta]
MDGRIVIGVMANPNPNLVGIGRISHGRFRSDLADSAIHGVSGIGCVYTSAPSFPENPIKWPSSFLVLDTQMEHRRSQFPGALCCLPQPQLWFEKSFFGLLHCKKMEALTDYLKAVEEQHGTSTCNGVHEVGEPARIEHHWRTVLEQLLPSEDVGLDGIWNCLRKALMSGHFSFANKSSTHATKAKYTPEGNRNFCNETKRVNNFFKTAEKHEDSTSSEVQRDSDDQTDVHVITRKCQNVLIEVLLSDKFASLCDLLLENFPGIKADSIVDLHLINSKMRNGAYGRSAGLLHQDLQQVWERIRKIGQEMSLLATSLSNISQASCQSQKPSRVGTEKKNSMDSHTTTQFPCESDRSTKHEQTEASCLYKVSTCKECDDKLDGKGNVICDGCEAIYHSTCVPEVHGTSSENWYCPLCTVDKRESVEHNIVRTHVDGPHQNCIVCDRLKALGMIEQPTKDELEDATTDDESRESSVSSMDSEGSPQPSRTAMSNLCKICGTCEDEDKRFIKCDHSLCLYKYYHIRCLKTSQIAIRPQVGCWYCPSCLCRACLKDKDDDLIVMCDGCDEAYHTYCMKPPLTSVPKGKWYCVPCNILRAKQGMKNYEQWILQQHNKSGDNLCNGSNRSMDLLVSAVEKVERLAAVRQKR